MRPLVLLIPWLLTAVVAAETATPEDAGDAAAVAALFAAGQPAATAWAAYHAARLGLEDERSRLVEVLLKPTTPNSPERTAAQACAAALADFRQPVAAEVPPALWSQGARAESVVLVALEPARHERWLIERLAAADTGDTVWLAVVQLLAGIRSVAAVDAILRGVAPVLTVEARDPDDNSIHGEGRPYCSADGVSRRRAGFPPVVRWSLSTWCQVDAPLVAGPDPVWAVRQEQLEERKGVGSSGEVPDRNEVRVAILAGLVPEAAPGLQAGPVRDVAWNGEAAFVQACADLLTAEQQRWQALVDALRRADLLPAATQPPQVRLQLKDLRREAGRAALPTLPAGIERTAP